jgi:hypothetical protein
MKLLRVARIKVMTSKGRINKDETVVLDDAECAKILYMTPDAFEVIDDNYVEPKAVIAEPVEVAPKPRRARKIKVVE